MHQIKVNQIDIIQEEKLKIGIPKETLEGETRVAVVPSMVASLKGDKNTVLVETGAGLGASFTDNQYQDAGASIVKSAKELYKTSDVVLKVNSPHRHLKVKKHENGLRLEML